MDEQPLPVESIIQRLLEGMDVNHVCTKICSNIYNTYYI